MSLILASGSPRRRELMALITPNYTVAPSDVDESRITAATPAQLAQALAEAKALAVAQQHPDDTVIGCDTVVDCDGAVFGKPSGEEDAVRMLHALSARYVLCAPGQRAQSTYRAMRGTRRQGIPCH